jgi:DNA-binding GntR family transcriptional regulator
MGSQANQVYDDVIGRVLSRQLIPGDRIDERDLQDRLGLSATPVREAIIALDATGIVQRRPRSGARITSLDLEGLIKLIEVHAEIEGTIASRAARRINSDQARHLEQTVQACLDFNDPARPQKTLYFDLNLNFHWALTSAAGNEHLQNALYFTGNRLIGYLAARHALPGEPARSATDHQKICEAVLDSNADKARDLMVNHVIFDNNLALDIMNGLNDARVSPSQPKTAPAKPPRPAGPHISFIGS